MIEDRKIIKEAVVAIPYILREDLPVGSEERVQFIAFDEETFEKASRNKRLIEA